MLDESGMPGAREGHLVELFEAAGLRRVEDSELVVSRVEYSSFDDWWEPFTFGVGPAGAFVAALDPQQREALDERCRELLRPPPFELESSPGPPAASSSTRWTGPAHRSAQQRPPSAP